MSTSVLAAERLASLAKPPGSLGTLEDWAATLCTVQGTLTPAASPQTVLVFCADHGVKKADAALSPFPASVSQAVFRSLLLQHSLSRGAQEVLPFSSTV